MAHPGGAPQGDASRPPGDVSSSRLILFWAIFALAQSFGTLAGLTIGDLHDSDLFRHDAIAYLLLAAVSCLSVVELEAAPGLRRVAWILAVLGSAAFALQLASAWGLFQIPGLDPWYWDRFRGWSDNPNQLSFLCAALGFIALYLAETAASPGERIAAISCVILPCFVGLLTQSNTLTLVLAATGPIFVAFKLWTWVLSARGSVTLRLAFAWILLLALPLVVATAASCGHSITGRDENTDQEAELRLHTWSEAWRRGLESGLLGLGPGPHLKIPASLLAARLAEEDDPLYDKHPKPGAAPNFEAHNTLLDLFTQGGLIAVLSFVWLEATAFFIAYKARLVALMTSVIGLGTFSMFHFTARHPIFWFVIALCLVAGDGGVRVIAVRDRG